MGAPARLWRPPHHQEPPLLNHLPRPAGCPASLHPPPPQRLYRPCTRSIPRSACSGPRAERGRAGAWVLGVRGPWPPWRSRTLARRPSRQPCPRTSSSRPRGALLPRGLISPRLDMLKTATKPDAVTRLWTPQDVAEFLGVPVGTLYQWRSRGIGPPAHRVGRHLRYEPDAVRAWLIVL